MRQDPDDDFEDHEADDQDEGDRQVPAIRVSADAVRMVSMVVIVAVVMLMVMVSVVVLDVLSSHHNLDPAGRRRLVDSSPSLQRRMKDARSRPI